MIHKAFGLVKKLSLGSVIVAVSACTGGGGSSTDGGSTELKPVEPTLLKDINTGASSSMHLNAVTAGNKLFFFADDGVHGKELWASDGTTDGTILVKDIRTGANGSSGQKLAAMGNKAYFLANDGTGDQLWVSDGTESGTKIVKSITANSIGGPEIVHKDKLYFVVNQTGVGAEVWVTDGTDSGTNLLKDIRTGGSGSNPSIFFAFGDYIYFSADEATNGAELWRSNGTEAGTQIVANIASSTSSSNPAPKFVMGGELYFTTFHDQSLRKVDANNNVTVVTALPQAPYISAPILLNSGLALFSFNDNTHGTELWATDGTSGGTKLVKDIYVGSNGADFGSEWVVVNGKLYFTATDDGSEFGLWESDGTAAGTKIVKDNVGSQASPVYAIGSKVYFRCSDPSTGQELCVSDGTESGTKVAYDINVGSGNGSPFFMGKANDLYFLAVEDGTHGHEPFVFRP